MNGARKGVRHATIDSCPRAGVQATDGGDLTHAGRRDLRHLPRHSGSYRRDPARGVRAARVDAALEDRCCPMRPGASGARARSSA